MIETLKELYKSTLINDNFLKLYLLLINAKTIKEITTYSVELGIVLSKVGISGFVNISSTVDESESWKWKIELS